MREDEKLLQFLLNNRLLLWSCQPGSLWLYKMDSINKRLRTTSHKGPDWDVSERLFGDVCAGLARSYVWLKSILFSTIKTDLTYDILSLLNKGDLCHGLQVWTFHCPRFSPGQERRETVSMFRGRGWGLRGCSTWVWSWKIQYRPGRGNSARKGSKAKCSFLGMVCPLYDQSIWSRRDQDPGERPSMPH